MIAVASGFAPIVFMKNFVTENQHQPSIGAFNSPAQGVCARSISQLSKYKFISAVVGC